MADQDPPKGKVERSRRERRNKIQIAIEQAEEERRKELFRKRLEIANQGLKNFQDGKIQDAVKNFQLYLKILEQWKGVGENGLLPSHFDRNKERAEILLVSGVYWDLAKLYDRTKSKEKQKEFGIYLQKFVLFSKGFAHQRLSAETLRKYLTTDRAIHRDEFRASYKTLADYKCYVATSLADVCSPETLPRLRDFRDQVLEPNPLGRKFVDWYYRHGEALAEATSRMPDRVRVALGRGLDHLSAVLGRFNEPRAG